VKSKLFKDKFRGLGSDLEIQIYSTDGVQDLIFSLARSEVKRVEEKYSRFRADSTLSRINATAGSDRLIEVDDETASLLNFGAAAFATSEGKFDLTSGPLSRKWNFKEKIVPEQNEIAQALQSVGWKKLYWDGARIGLPVEGMQLDFGGIGKEYAVDRVAGLLIGRGIRHGLINFGGDLRVIGTHPDGKPWEIGIRHPRISEEILAALGAKAGSIATSGDYERYFEIDGKRYCHIVNPLSGFPAEGLQAVTVFADSCLVAGTAATIAMLSGEIGSRNYLDELGVPYIAVVNESTIYMRGFADFY